MSIRRLWPLFLVGLLGLVLLNLRGRSYDDIEVRVQLVVQGVLAPRLALTGSFDYGTVTEIRPELIAPVEKILVRPGQLVRAGDTLVLLRAPELGAEVERLQASADRLRAQIAGAEVRVDEASKRRERYTRLGRERLLSRDQMENAVSDHLIALADLRAARASLSEAESSVRHASVNRDKLKVVSPAAGTVVDIGVREGEVAVPTSAALPGSLLLKIADTGRPVARVELSEAELSKVRVGDVASVRSIVLGGAPIKGRVASFDTVASAGGDRRFHAEIELLGAELPLHVISTTCIAEIVSSGAGKAGPIVPVEAVRYPGQNYGTDDIGSEYVIRVRDGTVDFVPVRTGLSDNRRQRIEHGVAPGDLVVTGPADVAAGLMRGQKVAAGHPRE